MNFDQEKFIFYLKYLVLPEKLGEFHSRLKNLMLAIQINPDLAQEAKDTFIQEYPFTKEFF